jgi:hypothetical protein
LEVLDDWTEGGLFAEDYEAALKADPCVYCGGRGGILDHIVARHWGGPDDWANYAGICRSCNSSKGIKTLLAFLGWQLCPAPEWNEIHPPRPMRPSRPLTAAELDYIRVNDEIMAAEEATPEWAEMEQRRLEEVATWPV